MTLLMQHFGHSVHGRGRTGQDPPTCCGGGDRTAGAVTGKALHSPYPDFYVPGEGDSEEPEVGQQSWNWGPRAKVASWSPGSLAAAGQVWLPEPTGWVAVPRPRLPPASSQGTWRSGRAEVKSVPRPPLGSLSAALSPREVYGKSLWNDDQDLVHSRRQSESAEQISKQKDRVLAAVCCWLVARVSPSASKY